MEKNDGYLKTMIFHLSLPLFVPVFIYKDI